MAAEIEKISSSLRVCENESQMKTEEIERLKATLSSRMQAQEKVTAYL